MTPDQAAFFLNLTLPALKNEHATTKRVIAAIPLDKGDYRPEPVAKSALELAWHIVAAEHRFLSGVVSGAFDFTPIPRPESAGNSSGIADWFEKSFTQNLARLEKLSAEELGRTLDFRGMFQFPAAAFLQISMNHTIHHRGQLSTYLRPMGAKVPAIYGESYDSAQERSAIERK